MDHSLAIFSIETQYVYVYTCIYFWCALIRHFQCECNFSLDFPYLEQADCNGCQVPKILCYALVNYTTHVTGGAMKSDE